MKDFLGKSNGKTLREHSLEVYNKAMEICREGGLVKEDARMVVAITALLHDIGKATSYYQKWLTSGETAEVDETPRHNDVGAAIVSAILSKDESAGVISEAVRRHHYSWNMNGSWTLGDILKEDEMRDILDFSERILLDAGITEKYINLNEDWEDISVMDSSFKSENSAPNADLKKITLYDVAHSIVRYADYVVSGEIEEDSYKRNRDDKQMVMPESFDKERWDKQMTEIEEILEDEEHPTYYLEAPTGYGKTVMGLQYLLSDRNRKGYWVLPDNNLALEVYTNITTTLPMCGMEDIKVSLLIGGEYAKGDKDTDIVVTNIDNYTNGMFKNAWKVDSVDRMLCNVIFDEFHKYFTPQGALMATFVSALRGRWLFRDVRTLIMSATGIILDNEKKYFINEADVKSKKIDDSPIYDKKIRINFIEDWDSLKANIKESSMIVSTSVNRCQEICADDYFHSRFTDEDKKSIYERLRNEESIPRVLSATNIICEGYNITKNVLYMCNCTPDSLIQAGGRINRFDNSKLSEYNLMLSTDKRDTGIFADKNGMAVKMFDNVVKGWHEFLKESLRDENEITLRRLCELRNEFYQKEDEKHNSVKLINKLALEYIKSSIKNFFDIQFKRGTSKKEDGESNGVAHIAKGNTLRGNISTIFAVARDNEHEWTNGYISIKDVAGKGWREIFNMNNPKCRKDYNESMLREMKDSPEYKEALFGKCYKKVPEKCLEKDDFFLFNKAIEKATSSATPFKIFPCLGYSYEKGKGLVERKI